MKDVMALPAADTRAGALGARVVSAIVLVPPVLFAVYAGSPYFDLLVALGALILAWEWARLCGGHPFVPTGALLAVVVLLPLAASAAGHAEGAVLGLAGGAVVVFVAAAVGALRASGKPVRPGWLAAGVIAIGAPCLALLWLRADPAIGRATIFWLFAVVWAVDIGAYVCGRLIGGPLLAPAISPKKTWAGLIGGVACGGAVGAAGAAFLGDGEPVALTLVSVAVGAATQIGDLAESWLKRHFHAKDASGLIPGHGGLFDRVDGLLVASTAVALFAIVGGEGILSWT